MPYLFAPARPCLYWPCCLIKSLHLDPNVSRLVILVIIGYWSLYLNWLFSLLTHRHRVYTGRDSCTERPILNKFSSRATASDFQCWKYIYPSLKLLCRRGMRSSRLLSNGRLHESTSSRSLWKEGALLWYATAIARPGLGKCLLSIYVWNDSLFAFVIVKHPWDWERRYIN